MGVQGVVVLGRLLRLNLHSQRARDVSSVAISSLPIINTTHVHDAVEHLPAQEPICKRREETRVPGKGVGGEDVRVRVTRHAVKIILSQSLNESDAE